MGLIDETKNNKSGNYYKMTGKEVTFQLIDLNTTEVFKIYVKPRNKYYREDEMIETDDGSETIEVGKLKFVKEDTIKQYIKDATKVTEMHRRVLIDGQEYIFPMKKTANDKLVDAINIIQGMEQDPLQINFKLEKEGEKLDTKYKITPMGKATVKPKQVTLKMREPNDNEQELIDGFKEVPSNQRKFALFKSIYEDNKEELGYISEERLEELFAMIK